MKNNHLFLTIILAITLSAAININTPLHAGAGKSFGYFAGGVGTGVLLDRAFSSRRSCQPETRYVERHVVREPVYVQQDCQQYVQEIRELKRSLQKAQELIDEQCTEIRQLKREREKIKEELAETKEALQELKKEYKKIKASQEPVAEAVK